jgi:hypothetical protein
MGGLEVGRTGVSLLSLSVYAKVCRTYPCTTGGLSRQAGGLFSLPDA